MINKKLLAVWNVNHDILLRNLKNYVICGTTNKQFKTYLTVRSQNVKTNDKSSLQHLNISHRVTQGAVLGPISFTIYLYEWLT